MPIILAIEPDRRQRDALAAVVRQRVGAELILADTTERALEAIGNRVPDLVLVPALLAPQDDAALAAALRVIAAAAHVRTVTIPVLAAHAAPAPAAGLLSRWRRARPASETPDGCDPAVFADQILAYLKESAAERALMLDDAENEDLGIESFAQELGREDAQPEANASVQAGAQAYVTDPAPAYETDLQYGDQPDAHAYGQPDMAHVQSDVQPYAQPDVAYMQPDVQAYAQPDVAYVQPDVQAYVQTEVQMPLEPDLQTYSPPVVEAYAEPTVQNEEVLDLVEGDYDPEDAGGDGLSTLRLNQEEDIDLSDELAGLETEEPYGMRRDASETELFDGEPVGVYTMSFGIDEPDVDAAVLDARKAFAEVEAAIEPAFDAKAFAESEFEAEAAVDPEFFAETITEHEFGDESQTELEREAEAAVALAFTSERVAGADTFEDISPEEAAPRRTAAEPWVATFQSPRWVWPVMEGVPAETPAAFIAAEIAVAETRPAMMEARPAIAEARPAMAEARRAVAAARPVAAEARPVAAEARPAPAPHKRDRPEWSELVASLRKDIERRRVDPPQEKPKPSAQVPAPRRSKQPKPVQDEWGFFDPEQCGFAALLAKLDEITESAEDTEVRQPK